jgi:dienelactone hydrolase
MKRKILIISSLIALAFTHPEHSFNERAGAQEFAAWQKETRALLSEILYNGPPPEAVPLDPEYGRTERRESYTLTYVKLHDRPGHTTSGYLARPVKPRADRLPALISLHGHDWQAHDTFNPDNMYYYGDLLARKGYVVLAVNIDHEYLDHEKRIQRLTLPKDEPFPLTGQKVWMVKRAIDLLSEQPDVDPEKIGCVGLSNGGFTTMFVAAMDQRVKLAVSSGSLIMHDRMWHRELIHCRCQYLPGMEDALDYYDVFALAAPRPLVVQNGEKDPIFPIKSARRAFTYIQKAYEIAGAPDKVFHDVHDGAHEFRSEVPLQWFERHLPIQ